MKAMVHNSKARVRTLAEFIMENVCGHHTSFEISDIKQDGTVFVKFRSSTTDPAIMLANGFAEALNAGDRSFARTEECKFRLALDQF
jgi:hypothetical protein